MPAGLPTAIALSSTDAQFTDDLQQLLHCGKSFRVYSNPDFIGVQLGGAVKNVIAIGAGMSDGIGFGANARTALIYPVVPGRLISINGEPVQEIVMKKMLRFVLLLIVVMAIAGGVGVWKVRQMENSQILIKEETIFTLKAGTGRLALGEQLYGDKIINRPRVFQWLLRFNVQAQAVGLFSEGMLAFDGDFDHIGIAVEIDVPNHLGNGGLGEIGRASCRERV